MSFLSETLKELDNQYAAMVNDGTIIDLNGFIDTGSYVLNALLSGSIFGGLPNNKITALAGDPSTGKTFFSLSIVKYFLDHHPNGEVVYFESESSVSKEIMESRKIDTSRVGLVPVSTVQEFRTQALRIVDSYSKLTQDKRPPLLFVLDSLGMLSTTKEMEDSLEGKETRDMTRAQVIKSIFRVLSLKLGMYKIPLIVTNHTYAIVGSYVPQKDMGGGTGLKYAASTIVQLSKSKEKEGTTVVGNIIKCKADKSRFTKENSQAEVRLFYDERGLDRYYGLLELGEKHGVFEKVGNRYKMNDANVYPKTILENPEKYFTEDILKKLDDAAKKEFMYGSFEPDSEDNGEEVSE